jgi:hypothetical protein
MRFPLLALFVAASVAAACGSRPAPPGEDGGAARQAGLRDTTLVVTGPTLVALFGNVTQEQMDGEPDLGEALADFQYYVGGIVPHLQAAGVALHEVYADSLRLRDGAPAGRLWTFGADSTRYVYLAPGREPRTLASIATDLELLHVAAEYFRIPALTRFAEP